MLLRILGIVFVLILLFLSVFFLKWLKVMKGIKFYKAQGASVIPGASRFLVGNQLDLMKIMKKKAASPKPMKRYLSLLVESVPGCDSEETSAVSHKLIVYTPIGRIMLIVSDPDMVQDLFLTKNKVMDKAGDMANNMKILMGNSFLFSKGGAVWKAKR